MSTGNDSDSQSRKRGNPSDASSQQNGDDKSSSQSNATPCGGEKRSRPNHSTSQSTDTVQTLQPANVRIESIDSPQNSVPSVLSQTRGIPCNSLGTDIQKKCSACNDTLQPSEHFQFMGFFASNCCKCALDNGWSPLSFYEKACAKCKDREKSCKAGRRSESKDSISDRDIEKKECSVCGDVLGQSEHFPFIGFFASHCCKCALANGWTLLSFNEKACSRCKDVVKASKQESDRDLQNKTCSVCGDELGQSEHFPFMGAFASKCCKCALAGGWSSLSFNAKACARCKSLIESQRIAQPAAAEDYIVIEDTDESSPNRRNTDQSENAQHLEAQRVQAEQEQLPIEMLRPDEIQNVQADQEQLPIEILSGGADEAQKSPSEQEQCLIEILRANLGPEFELQDVDNTGHCQFDAIARQIRLFAHDYPNLTNAAEYTYQQVRRDISSWLRCNGDFLLENGETVRAFLMNDDAEDWDTYCLRVADDLPGALVQWGDHITLRAAAEVYRRTIRVWRSLPGGQIQEDIEPFDPIGQPQHAELFNLAHIFEVHYMSVVRK